MLAFHSQSSHRPHASAQMSHVSCAALCTDQEAASAQNESSNKCTQQTAIFMPFLCEIAIDNPAVQAGFPFPLLSEI